MHSEPLDSLSHRATIVQSAPTIPIKPSSIKPKATMRSPEISSALSKMKSLRRNDMSAASMASSAGSISIAGEKTRLLANNGHRHATTSPELITKESSMFAPGTEAPPLVQWLPPALICALSYALYNIFIKKGSASIHPILGGVILQIVAAILGIVLCSYLAFGPAQEPMFWDLRGFVFAILAGISV